MTDVDRPPAVALEGDGEPVTDAAAVEADLAVAPELVADSLADYLRGRWLRMKAGDSGVLPVIAGLILISVLFHSLNSNFLTAPNVVNLLVQGAPYMLLAMGMIFALLLGEIDLSIGFVSGIGGTVMAELVKNSVGWPWWAAILAGLATCAVIGLFQGTIITRLGLPSFVVTLAGLLGFQGVLLLILGSGGSLSINDNVINDLASGNLTPAASWIVMLGIVGALRPDHLGAGGPAAGQRPGGAAGQPHPGQDRRGVRRRHRPRPRLQHQPGPAGADPGRAVGGPHRPRRARPVDRPPRAHQVRPVRLRHRGQRRGRPPGRCEPRRHPHPVLRAGVVHRRDRRHRLRVTAALGLHVARRRHPRPVRRGRRRHRRHQPVRRPGQGRPRGARADW